MKKTVYYKLCKGASTPYMAKESTGYRMEFDTVDEIGENQKVVVFLEKEEGNGWTITEESTGLSVANGFATKAKAEEKLTAEFVESTRKAIKRSRVYVDILGNEKQKILEEREKSEI